MPQNSPSASAFQFLAVFFISTPAFQFPGAIFSSISGHFNAAFLIVQCYLSHINRLQFITHFNQITASTILTLLTFLQLKYQGIHDQNESPFSTHPIALRVAIAAAAVQHLAYAAVLRFPLHRLAFLAHHLLVTSGYMAVASLSSVVLPDSAAPFVYAIFGLLAAAELLLWLYRKLVQEEEDVAEFVFQRRRIRRFFYSIFGNLGNFYEQRIGRLPV